MHTRDQRLRVCQERFNLTRNDEHAPSTLVMSPLTGNVVASVPALASSPVPAGSLGLIRSRGSQCPTCSPCQAVSKSTIPLPLRLPPSSSSSFPSPRVLLFSLPFCARALSLSRWDPMRTCRARLSSPASPTFLPSALCHRFRTTRCCWGSPICCPRQHSPQPSRARRPKAGGAGRPWRQRKQKSSNRSRLNAMLASGYLPRVGSSSLLSAAQHGLFQTHGHHFVALLGRSARFLTFD